MRMGKWVRFPKKPPFVGNVTVAATFAIWGAFLSSIALGAGLFRYMARRGKMRLLCFVEEEKKGRPLLFWNVTNVGNETIVITRMGATLADGEELLATPRTPFPHTLRPGEFSVGTTDLRDVSPPLGGLERVSSLWAVDNKGRRVALSGRTLKRLKTKPSNV